jgi:hypothetical protein
MPDTDTIETSEVSTTTRRRTPQFRVTRVGIQRTARSIIVTLPASAGQYLNINEDTESLFAVPVNGVVQLANFQPNIAIPVSRISEDDFIEQQS